MREPGRPYVFEKFFHRQPTKDEQIAALRAALKGGAV